MGVSGPRSDVYVCTWEPEEVFVMLWVKPNFSKRLRDLSAAEVMVTMEFGGMVLKP